MANPGWHKEMPRGLIDRIENREIFDTLVVQHLNQASARPAKIGLYLACHQVSAEASIA
jgi:hypothetical protein